MESLLNILYPQGSHEVTFDELKKGLAALPQDNRTAIQLHYIDNLPRKQIALQLGWSISKVNQKITRGITLLKVKLNPGYFRETDKVQQQLAQRLLLR